MVWLKQSAGFGCNGGNDKLHDIVLRRYLWAWARVDGRSARCCNGYYVHARRAKKETQANDIKEKLKTASLLSHNDFAGLYYRPKTRETMQSYELILSFIQVCADPQRGDFVRMLRGWACERGCLRRACSGTSRGM
jgi:hypothetical protein